MLRSAGDLPHPSSHAMTAEVAIAAPLEPVHFATHGHHFSAADAVDIPTLAAQATAPLSVIVQITKRCNFDCSFCSETLQMRDPSIADLATMATNLSGTKRVFLSGGEPLLRRDFIEVVDLFHKYIVGVPTNATRGLVHARAMAGKVAFVNVGLEGPRATTNRVRGDYDKVLAGVHAFVEAGLPISLSAVVYRSTLAALPFTYQIADVLGAGKLKLILPLRKGNALHLEKGEFISHEEAGLAFDRLLELRSTFDWRPALRMTTWTPENEGHMIVVEPNGTANAWPVYDAPDLFEPLGNILEEPITALWARYRFRTNHFAKYLGHSIRSVEHSEPSRA
jgi:MoaA/NifB/PqqE/SkfB family radical SAM enzyme